MKGALLDKGEKFYTHLNKVFESIKNIQLEYNWLITDCECYPDNQEYQKLLSEKYCWISGEQLTKMIRDEDFQWIWAVLSGFNKKISLEDVLMYPLPYTNEYTGFWQNPVSLQHPLAEIEIAPWDSSLVLLISSNDKIVDDFMNAFPKADNLEEYNSD